MNRNLIILLAGVFLFSSSLLFAAEKVSVRVDGLSCAFCAYSLEKNLKEIEGVEKVEINLKDGIAVLTLKEDAVLDDEMIKKRVEDSGFTPREVKRISVKKDTLHEQEED